MKKEKILIVVGSKNDVPHLSEMVEMFKRLKINSSISVISSHRNLPKLVRFLNKDKLKKDNVRIIISVARSVANLPAIIAGYLKETSISVIGVGLSDKNLKGKDSLLSVNTIPSGVPLLNTGIDKAGIYNATIAAIKILAINDNNLEQKLKTIFKR